MKLKKFKNLLEKLCDNNMFRDAFYDFDIMKIKYKLLCDCDEWIELDDNDIVCMNLKIDIKIYDHLLIALRFHHKEEIDIKMTKKEAEIKAKEYQELDDYYIDEFIAKLSENYIDNIEISNNKVVDILDDIIDL